MNIKFFVRWQLLAITFLFATNSCADGLVHNWTNHTLDNTVTLQYPADWWQKQMYPGRLVILSPGRGQTGVLIDKGQGGIIIAVEAIDPNETLDQVIKYNIRNQELISESELKISDLQRNDGCSQLREVISRNEVGPGVFQINTGIFCELNDRKRVIILLLTWEDDKDFDKYKQIAEQIAMSIKGKSNE